MLALDLTWPLHSELFHEADSTPFGRRAGEWARAHASVDIGLSSPTLDTRLPALRAPRSRICACLVASPSVCPRRPARHPLLRLLNGVLAAAVWLLLPSTLAADPCCFLSLSHFARSSISISTRSCWCAGSHAAAARPAACCGLVVVAAARGVGSASGRAPAVCLDVGSSYVLHALAAVSYI